MADIQKPIRNAIIEEGPAAISLAKETWQALMNKPELRDLLRKFDVGSSGGKVRIVGGTPAERSSLAQTLRESAPPSGASGAEVVDPSRISKNTNFTTSSSGLMQTVDPAKLPVPASNNLPTVALPASASSAGAVGALPPGTAPASEVFATKPLSTVLKTGAGLAAGGAAAYGLSQVGSQTEMPAQTATPAAPGTGSASSSAGSSGAGEAPAEEPGRVVPVVTAAQVRMPAAFQDALTKLEQEKPAASKVDWGDADEEKWNKQIADIRRIQAEAQKRNDWAEVAERLGQAMTQMFAAKQGLATGTDLSGLKFDKTDWARKQDALINQLKTDVGIVDDQKRSAKETVRTAREALDKWRSEYRRAAGDKAKAEVDIDSANARARQSASEANARLQDAEHDRQSRESQTDARIDAQLQAATLRRLGASIKTDETKQKAFRAVVAQIQTSKNPGNLEDPAMRSALQQYIKAGLGEETDFAALLPKVDSRGWEFDSTKKANWVRELEEKTGLAAPSAAGGAAPEVRNGKRIKAKQVNPQTKQTRYTYEDGSTETVEGIE